MIRKENKNRINYIGLYPINNEYKRKEVMEWLSQNWEWVLLIFMIAEKIVKMSPTDKDDILLDVVIEGLTKMVKGKKDD